MTSSHLACQSVAPVSQRLWVQIPYRPDFFSGLIFTTAQVVCITARITFIHVFTRSSNIWLSDILSLLKEDIITMKVEDTKKN